MQHMGHQKQLMIDLLIARPGPTGYSLAYSSPKINLATNPPEIWAGKMLNNYE